MENPATSGLRAKFSHTGRYVLLGLVPPYLAQLMKIRMTIWGARWRSHHAYYLITTLGSNQVSKINGMLTLGC